ncbi:MAG TPA: hypothetical protein VHC49_22760 [Mycobacteriales bacterium]|nr:hypothetical protein [Mycobacteriales bacterium]
MSEPARHAPPFYCPYCGGEDIRPAGTDPGGWSCAECRRAWRLKFLGISAEDAASGQTAGNDGPRSIQ